MDDDLRELRIEDRETREAIEAAASQIERAKRGLDEVALEFMHRGDTIRIAVGSRAWIGTVVHVGLRLLRLRIEAGAVIDVDLSRLTSVSVVHRSPTGGRSPGGPDPATMIALLRQLEHTHDAVEIGGPELDPVTVRVLVVAQTHIEGLGVDGTEWVFPLHSIGYVSRPGVPNAR
ncbi:MAG: hypothetical protein ACRDQ7_21120 [Haloechinothrix sp.]